jgi:phospholipid-binding lipoprotein MlaA
MLVRSILNTAILVIICGFASSSLAAKKSKDKYAYNYAALNNRCQVYDPYESFNRKIFVVNSVLDTFILRPFAKGYGRFTNQYTKQRIGSFVDNISEPLSTVNYGLQGKSNGMFKTFWRFTINSTFGVLGLFDVASKVGLKAESQTFGNTLGHYGVGSGPYIVLPLFGGMGDRYVINLRINCDLNLIKTGFIPTNHQLHSDFNRVTTVVNIIHKREMIMPFTDHISKNSPDPYIAIRDAIIQQREAQMDYPVGFKCPTVNK